MAYYSSQNVSVTRNISIASFEKFFFFRSSCIKNQFETALGIENRLDIFLKHVVTNFLQKFSTSIIVKNQFIFKKLWFTVSIKTLLLYRSQTFNNGFYIHTSSLGAGFYYSVNTF